MAILRTGQNKIIYVSGSPLFVEEDGQILVSDSFQSRGWIDECRFCGKPFLPNERGVCPVCGGFPYNWDVRLSIN
jgi:hypothetical protein